jgi:hypothetical protein
MTADYVTQKTTLLFDKASVDAINALLQGTSTYTMAVASGLKIQVPTDLAPKLSYVDSATGTGPSKLAHLVITGILTPDETTKAKALSTDSTWAAAIDRARKKAMAFFDTTLSSLFSNKDEAIGTLLAGDVAPHTIQPPAATTGATTTTGASTDPPAAQADPGTAPGKQLYFLQYFVPYLREQLSDQLVVNTMEDESGLSSPDLSKALLTSLLTIDGDSGSTSQTPLQVLRGLNGQATSGASGWTGYLIPSATDVYTIVGFGLSRPAPLTIGGELWTFDVEQEDPEGAWWTSPRPLTGGRLYLLNSGDQAMPGLQWKTPYSQPSAIPSSALLPNTASDTVTKVFVKLAKAAVVINGVPLTYDEVEYFKLRKSDFSNFDLDKTTLDGWERMLDYEALKTSLPSSAKSLLDVFKWASTSSPTSPPTAKDIAAQISDLTAGVWPAADVETIIGASCFGLNDVKYYLNEIALIKLQTAFVAVRKIAVDIPMLFKWADPLAKFWPTHAVAEDMRNRIRSRYTLDDWEQLAAPLHNQLRMLQRDALVAYLIVQKQLMEWGVVDADSLFEFFLIDVQMGACLKTSRIKQAISTVQTFIQRCFLGLETGPITAAGVPTITPDTLDRERWQWMQKQTLWTANMKVLVNPESYLVESLRDNKSPFYANLENELKQKDVNDQTLQESIKKYVSDVDKVANLVAEGLFEDSTDSNLLHIIARTRSSPYFRFYRTYSPAVGSMEWTPWQPVPVDIQMYHVDPVFGRRNRQTSAQSDGNYVFPVIFQRRLHIFFAQITPYSVAPRGLANQQLGTGTPSVSDIDRLQSWKIQLGWSEFRGGKWLTKQLTTDFVMEPPTSPTPPAIDKYLFVPAFGTDTNTGNFLQIAVFNSDKTCVGGFQYQGSQTFVISRPTIVASGLFPLGSNQIKWDGVTTRFHMSTENPPTVYSLQCEDVKFQPSTRPFIQ